MKLLRTTEHSRTLLATELTKSHPNDLSELEIQINYTGTSNVENAIPLDNQVIPQILANNKLAQELRKMIHQLQDQSKNGEINLGKDKVEKLQKLLDGI